MKVIFLDIDGVLNSELWALEMSAKKVYVFRDNILEERALKILQHIVQDSGAQLVLSSTWRITPKQYEDADQWLRKYGMHLIDYTRFFCPEDTCRGDEIAAWLREHPDVEQFVIIDDDCDMRGLTSHLVQTHFRTGLQEEHYDQAMKILMK